MFKKILVAVDGSDLSLKAAQKAMDLAKLSAASLQVVYVIDQRVFFFPHEIQVLAPENPYFKVLEDLRKNGDSIMATLRKEARKRDMEFEPLIMEGAVVDEIRKVIEKNKTDLLVIGAYGKTGELRGVLGSTAQALMHSSPSSVLVVHE